MVNIPCVLINIKKAFTFFSNIFNAEELIRYCEI